MKDEPSPQSEVKSALEQRQLKAYQWKQNVFELHFDLDRKGYEYLQVIVLFIFLINVQKSQTKFPQH